jgi:hypothetical protein
MLPTTGCCAELGRCGRLMGSLHPRVDSTPAYCDGNPGSRSRQSHFTPSLLLLGDEFRRRRGDHRDGAQEACPLWVINGHMQCKRARPLCPQKQPRKRIPANGHVCFTPESGHVQCTRLCLLWAKSGHSAIIRSARRRVRFAPIKRTFCNSFDHKPRLRKLMVDSLPWIAPI